MKTWIRALLLVSSAWFPLAAQAGPAEDASSVVDRWAAAYSANDAAAVQALYTPDAILLGTVSPIIGQGTENIKKYFSRLPGTGNKVVIGERRTIALGDSAALATGFYDFTIVRNGNPVASPARFTILVVTRGNDWLIAHHHSSQRPVPPR